MKRILLLYIFVAITLLSFAITKDEAVENLLNTYPKLQLVDIYKSFYQDNFGPGHILGDSLAAKRYFYSELNDTTKWGGPKYEYTGEGKNFVRLNMDLVREGIIPAEVYFQAFQNSLNKVKAPTDEVWIKEWTQIDSIVDSKGYQLINEEGDKKFINEKLKTKNFTVHHSDTFNSNYNFHYRIISIPEFVKLQETYKLLLTID